ncbi:MAG: hypothetical protein JWQ14_3059 [Adhaeribacter sp.]|nr:hypothetical protein [Adhaeribacter sp.]
MNLLASYQENNQIKYSLTSSNFVKTGGNQNRMGAFIRKANQPTGRY